MNNITLLYPFAGKIDNRRITPEIGYRYKFSEGLFPAQVGIPVQMHDEEDHIVVQAVLPGVSKSDLTVTVSERLVTLEVSNQSDNLEKEQDGKNREVLMRRDIRLGEDVEADRSESRLENGILEIRLAKSLKSQPTRLKIMG